MTKKQLSTAAGISMPRITQLMANMTANVDYVEVRNANNDPRIEFTESGISKVMNRNTKGGRAKIERVKKPRGRPKKVLHYTVIATEAKTYKHNFLQTMEKGGEV